MRASATGEVTFVYGGVFLPWQDPSVALETLVSTLEERNAGRLKLFGGKHPSIRIPPGKYQDLLPHLDRSPRVDLMGMIPRDALVETYLRSHVAIDVMARNPERELAFTTRTVEYLWCGLPVIYNNYAELADYIRDYDAGWTVDPLDANAIRSVIESILDNPDCIARKSINAQRLVRERLAWDRTIEPLDAFCREPRKHDGHKYPTLIRSISRLKAGKICRSSAARCETRAANCTGPHGGYRQRGGQACPAASIHRRCGRPQSHRRPSTVGATSAAATVPGTGAGAEWNRCTDRHVWPVE
jgi:hypothetical protein